MIKVSIIIPIYNAEKYLKQCIKSVLSQTLKELEIICVDDGSTDDSALIIKKLISHDKRIRLLHQTNQGAGIARNQALDKAKGKYVAFLDADDFYIDNDALRLMFDACEKNGLSASASLRKCLVDGMLEDGSLFQNVVKGKILDYCDYQIDYDYQNFIFLRKILVENSFYFPDYRRFQDPPFLVQVLYKIRKFMVIDTYLYCYRVTNPEVRFDNKKILDLLYGLIDNLTFAKENHLETLFQNTIYRLEYEYRTIILKNIDVDNLELLKLLMQANQIICSQKCNSNYIIKPLRVILLYANQYEVKLLERIKDKSEIVLYGAGKYGHAFLEFLKKNHFFNKVVYIVVSDLKENELYIDNIPVITLENLQRIGEKPVFVTVGEEVQPEIKEYLDKNNYQHYEIIKDEFLYAIASEMV
jgi:glycosyltransferase involved in cell wall biosynthesis